MSPVYKTPPWGVTDQPWFYNAAAEIRTSLDPEALLDLVLDTELRLKRVRRERWGPRVIDIDVLAYEGVGEREGRLTLPHPRMTERAFVMVPLRRHRTGPRRQGQDCRAMGRGNRERRHRNCDSRRKLVAPKDVRNRLTLLDRAQLRVRRSATAPVS